MKNATFFLTLLSVIILSSCSSTNTQRASQIKSGMPPMNGDPGKCYAKCLVPVKDSFKDIPYLRYTGDNPDQEGILTETIVIEEASSKWVKKKADRNCRSADPEDCLVWCLEKTPAVEKSYTQVIDTMRVKEFEEDVLRLESPSNEQEFTEWKEIVCEKDITKRLLTDIQLSLIAEGYLDGDHVTGKLDSITSKALKEYQQTMNIAIGALTIETLESLGIT